MLEAGISGSKFEIGGERRLNFFRTAQGTELGALVHTGCPGWLLSRSTGTQGDPQGHELALPSCLATSAPRLLNVPRKSLGGPTFFTPGLCDDSSHGCTKCIQSVFMSLNEMLWGWAKAASGPLSVAVCSGVRRWNGANICSLFILAAVK